jgi:transposase
MVAGTVGSLHKAGSRKMVEVNMVTAGIDTAKDQLDVAVHGQAGGFTVANNPAGWETLAAELSRIGVQRIGIEATGGYERGVTRHLQAAGFTVIVLQPLQVRAFAKLHLRRAKNDRLDAALIAACTQVIDRGHRIEPDPRFDLLADHLTYIEQIEDDIARFNARLEHVADRRLRRAIAADIVRLEKRRAAELKRLTAELHEHADLAQRLAPGAEHSRHRRAHRARVDRAHAGTRPAQPRTGRRLGRPGAVCAPERQAPGRDPHRRRPGAAAALALCRRTAGRVSLEPGPGGPLPAPDRTWQDAQKRPCRLRPQALGVRQHRYPPRRAMDGAGASRVMRSATPIVPWFDLQAAVPSSRPAPARPPRATQVKDGQWPPRSGAPASLTCASTAAPWSQQARQTATQF